jgi:hypothetical protein
MPAIPTETLKPFLGMFLLASTSPCHICLALLLFRLIVFLESIRKTRARLLFIA